MKVSICCLLLALLLSPFSSFAQTPSSELTAPSASTAVPKLVKFYGTAIDESGKPVTGVMGVTFLLYKDQRGGTPLWVETQNVQSDVKGHYTVMLGASTSNGVPLEIFSSAEAHWVGTQISGESEQPRVLLLSVPYALKAADSDTLGGLPASAFMQANPVEVRANAVSQAGSAPTGTLPPAGVGGTGVKNFVPLWTGAQTLGNSVIYETGGEVGVGTKTPGAEIDSVSTTIAVRGTSSGSGTTGIGVVGNATNTSGSNLGVFGQTLSVATGSAGVGGTATGATGGVFGVTGNTLSTGPNTAGVNGFDAANTGLGFGVIGGSNSATKGAAGVNGYESATTGEVYGVTGYTASTGQFAAGVNGVENATTGQVFGVNGVAYSTTHLASAINGYEGAVTGQVYGVTGGTNSTTSFAAGVNGYENATTGQVFGVIGTTQTTTDNAAGVYGYAAGATGSTRGVIGETHSTSNGAIGVFGYADSTTGQVWGVVGQTASPNGAGGIFTNLSGGKGQVLVGNGKNVQQVFSVDATGNGFYAGDLTVTGKLTKGSGSFKIDHPLDPANRYLSHSFVESPDMMNVYNGNITTDRHGLATVTLPDYFEALNGDFRYQLTVIGQFAQAIVAKKIATNRFVVRTSKPNVEVSWQVTGIRHDAYANTYRIPVEEDKTAGEQGYYLHPEAFGQPFSKSIQSASQKASATDDLGKVSNP